VAASGLLVQFPPLPLHGMKPTNHAFYNAQSILFVNNIHKRYGSTNIPFISAASAEGSAALKYYECALLLLCTLFLHFTTTAGKKTTAKLSLTTGVAAKRRKMF